MALLIRRLFGSGAQSLTLAADRSVGYAQRHMTKLGVAGIVCLIGYYFVWTQVYPEDYENLLVRAAGGLLCVPALFHHQIAKRSTAGFALYWIVAMTYVLPFVFGFMLAMNAALAPRYGHTNLIWPLQNVVALFLLILLINHGPLATLMWLIATGAILLSVYGLVPQPNVAELHRVYLDPMPLYGFILIIGSLSIRNRDIIEHEKLSAVASVGTTIAHELRTPFLGMRALVEGIEKYIPTLLRSYDLAVASGLPVERIRVSHVRGLNRSLERIRDEIDYSNAVVDMLLINSSEHPVKEAEFSLFSAGACVRDAIDRYPFTSPEEKQFIRTELDQDFTIRAPQLLIVHVLFNLIKNAVYYVRKAGHGDIRIGLVPGPDFNRMILEDTGTGIPQENMKRIFERFFTTTETGHGAGIGLSFCKIVMEGVGGSIQCDSELGKFTRFTLEFPRVTTNHD